MNKLFNMSLVACGITMCTLSATAAPLLGGVEFTKYPGNFCRASGANDSKFRSLGNRFKNVSASAQYIICPIPTNLDTNHIQAEDLEVNLAFYNEGTAPVSFRCVLNGYTADLAVNLSPKWSSSGVVRLPAGSVSNTKVSTEGSVALRSPVSIPPNVDSHFNVICSMPSKVSLLRLNVVHLPQL